jgi:hypothetical protein
VINSAQRGIHSQQSTPSPHTITAQNMCVPSSSHGMSNTAASSSAKSPDSQFGSRQKTSDDRFRHAENLCDDNEEFEDLIDEEPMEEDEDDDFDVLAVVTGNKSG